MGDIRTELQAPVLGVISFPFQAILTDDAFRRHQCK